MNSRLEKVRKLKLDVSEATPAPGRRWVLWLFLAIVVAGGAFLALKDMPLRNSDSPTGQASIAAPAAEPSAAPTETPRLSRFTAAGYVEPIPPFPIHISPLVLGRIDEFTVTEGQPVKAGQIIAKFNSQDFENVWRSCKVLSVSMQLALRWPRASLFVQKNLPLRGGNREGIGAG